MTNLNIRYGKAEYGRLLQAKLKREHIVGRVMSWHDFFMDMLAYIEKH